MQVGCDVRDGDNHDGRVELEGLAHQPFLAYCRWIFMGWNDGCVELEGLAHQPFLAYRRWVFMVWRIEGFSSWPTIERHSMHEGCDA